MPQNISDLITKVVSMYFQKEYGVKRFDVTLSDALWVELIASVTQVIQGQICEAEGCQEKATYAHRDNKTVYCEDDLGLAESSHCYERIGTELLRTITKIQLVQKKAIKQQLISAFIHSQHVSFSKESKVLKALDHTEKSIQNDVKELTAKVGEFSKPGISLSEFGFLDTYLQGIEKQLRAYQANAGGVIYEYFSNELFRTMKEKVQRAEERKENSAEILPPSAFNQAQELCILIDNLTAGVQIHKGDDDKLCTQLMDKLKAEFRETEEKVLSRIVRTLR